MRRKTRTLTAEYADNADRILGVLCALGGECLFQEYNGPMIDRDLLEMLVCPVCKTPLVEKGEGLKCGTCKRVYPIKDDIPVLLIDEATTDPS